MLWPKTSVTKIRYGSRKCGTRKIAVKLGNLLSASRRRRRVQLAPLWPHSSKPLLLVPFSAMESVLTKEWNADLSSISGSQTGSHPHCGTAFHAAIDSECRAQKYAAKRKSIAAQHTP